MEIRILVAGEQIGPYSETEVRRYLGQGLVSPSDLAVREGMEEWQPLTTLLATSSEGNIATETLAPEIPAETPAPVAEQVDVDPSAELVPMATEAIVPDSPQEIPAEPPAVMAGDATPENSTPTPAQPAETLAPSSPTMHTEAPKTLEAATAEATPTPVTLPAKITATQATKRKLNKIVIQPILPLEATPPTPFNPTATAKKTKTGRTALTIEPPRPTTALPPVAGFVAKEKKPASRTPVKPSPVAMGDLFDKPEKAATPPLLPAKPSAPPVLSSSLSAPAMEISRQIPSTPPPLLTKPEAARSSSATEKEWIAGIPNGLLYAVGGAALFFIAVIVVTVYLLFGRHDSSAAPSTASANAPPEVISTPPVANPGPAKAAEFAARGVAEQAKGDLASALADYDKALDLDPKDIKTCYRRGLARAAAGNFDGALADYNAVLSLEPKNADAYSNRGFVKQAKGDADGAIADYNLALSLNPKISGAFYNLGLIKVQRGDLDGAIDSYNHAIELDPKMAIAYYNRGNAKNTEGNLDGAIADYTQAITLNPGIALAYCNRGFARQSKGDLDGALTDYTQAVALNPKMAVAYYNRGLIRVQKDDLEGAIADSAQAIDLDPKNAQAYCNRGLARLGKNDLDGAKNDLLQFCALAPRDGGADAARLYLWVIAKKMNPKGTADADLSKALANDWNSPPEELSSKLASFVLGHLREKDLIANAASPDTSREPGQYCKAWYFAGIKRLLAGDVATGTNYLQRSVATNQSTFCEYIFAKAELQRLTAPHDSSAQTAAANP